MLPFAALIRRFERQHLVWACHQDRYYSKLNSLGTSVIIAGIKTATVDCQRHLGSFIGAGGLGTFIVLGFAL